MGIVCKTRRNDIEAFFERRLALMEQTLIERLRAIGEEVVNEARNLPASPSSASIAPHQPYYINWTYNLRSSIGGVVARDGKIVYTFGFDGKGDEGEAKGKEFVEELTRRFNSGIVLIVVAGMEYAAEVRRRGYWVTDRAELRAENLVPKMLHKLGLHYTK